MENLRQVQLMLENMDINFDSANLIQDNKCLFIHGDKTYRVRMPKHREKVEAEDVRNKKEMELVAQGGNYYKKELIALLLKNQNIDIAELEHKKEQVRNKIKENYLETMTFLSDEPNKIEECRKKFEELKKELIDVSFYITEKTKACIEDRVEKEAIEYLTSVCTEVLQDRHPEVWDNVWINYNHFKEDTSDLTEKAIATMVSLLVNTKD